MFKGFFFFIIFVYPRWWLDGSLYKKVEWKSLYHNAIIDRNLTDPIIFVNFPRNALTRLTDEIERFRVELNIKYYTCLDELRVA